MNYVHSSHMKISQDGAKRWTQMTNSMKTHACSAADKHGMSTGKLSGAHSLTIRVDEVDDEFPGGQEGLQRLQVAVSIGRCAVQRCFHLLGVSVSQCVL